MTLLKTGTAALAVLTIAAAAARADDASLPTVASGARPGPDLLYAPAPTAPQLQNTGVWKADPILVSGAEAYRDGEFLYQDFLFDDHGATGPGDDPQDPFNQVENMFAPKHGTLSYPTDTKTFVNNAADLVELRVKPLDTATALRVTVNSLKDPARTAFTVALGSSANPVAWPHGAGVKSPAQLFLTVHGATAELLDATGKALTPAPTATVDLERRQYDVRIPHAAWDPGTSTVRMAAGVGLWDPANGTYLVPGPTATATNPGGASQSGAALFNMAFRLNEPVPEISKPGAANTIVEGHALVTADGSWWRERQQGDELATGDVSKFAAQVDFAKLADGTTDDSLVPKVGHLDRIFASRFVLGQGADFDAKCLTSLEKECTGRYVGQLQPYALYVPKKPVPDKGFGLVVSMHGLSANYNEFLGSHEAEQLGERGTGSIFASPEGRGPDGSYKSYAEADVFEMWNDVARHYRLNPDLTDVTGYSMGGGGTYRLASRWPDLFARAFPIVGPPTSAASFTALRNVPVMAWYCQSDELVGPEDSEQAFLNAQQAGIRYDHWVFAPCGHITIGNNDEFGPAVDFLGTHTVDRDPAHVTYVFDPAQDPKALSSTDHAYWLSGLALAAGATSATIDARAHVGHGDPSALPVQPGAGTLGGSHGQLPYTRRTLAWGDAPAEAAANVIDVTATGLSAVTISPRRAGVGCDARINVTSATPLKVALAGCPAAAAPPSVAPPVAAPKPKPKPKAKPCRRRAAVVVKLARHIGRRRVLSSRISAPGQRPRSTHGRRITVSLRRAKGKHARVVVVYRLAGHRTRRTVRTYRTCAS